MPAFSLDHEWRAADPVAGHYCAVQIKVEGTITLDRPPPPCQNPDHPAFSDPGDPGEIEIDEIWAKIGETWWKWGTMQVQMMCDDEDFMTHVYEKAAEANADSKADEGDYLYEQAKDREMEKKWEEENGD